MVLAAEHQFPYRYGMNKLRDLREKAGLTQHQLAAAIRSHQPRIADWEREPGEPRYRRIPLEKARAAAKVLNCMLWDLRPDILQDNSFDLMLEGADDAFKDDVRDYIIFKSNQRR